jgi:hypothetical protein
MDNAKGAEMTPNEATIWMLSIRMNEEMNTMIELLLNERREQLLEIAPVASIKNRVAASNLFASNLVNGVGQWLCIYKLGCEDMIKALIDQGIIN